MFLFFTIWFCSLKETWGFSCSSSSWCSSSKFRRQRNLEYITTMCQNCVGTSNQIADRFVWKPVKICHRRQQNAVSKRICRRYEWYLLGFLSIFDICRRYMDVKRGCAPPHLTTKVFFLRCSTRLLIKRHGGNYKFCVASTLVT